MPLIYLSGAWVAGIFLGSKFSPHFALILTALVPLLLLLFFPRPWKAIILASLCLIAVFGGIFRFQSSLDTGLQPYNGTTAQIRGIVAFDPEIRDKVTHLRLNVSQVKLGQEWQPAEATVLLFVPRYPLYNYGDELLVSGKLEAPPQFDDFDYRGYLAHQGIYSIVRFPRIEVLSRGNGSRLLAGIYSLRSRLAQILAQVLPEPQAALAQGIILGIRSHIPSWLNDAFTRSGTTHLLVISGVNLSIVAGILVSLGLWLWGRRHYLYIWLALATIWFYTLITGMNPPVLRSAIMASLFLIAELLGRQRSAVTALSFAAAVMAAINPRVLWDASFQLSFLAMAGLILIVPSLQNWSRNAVMAALGEGGVKVSLASMITDSFSVTLGATIFVAPVIAYYFGIVSLVAPVATFLATPVLPAIVITGAVTAVLGLVALPVAQAAGWLAWLFVSYFLLVVRIFAAVPPFTIDRSVSTVVLGAYYLALALALYAGSQRKRLSEVTPNVVAYLKSGTSRVLALPKKWVIPPLLVLAVLTLVTALTMPDGNLHVSFLDVGQGDAILIQTPARQNILIDGGPSPQAAGLALGQKLPFWERTIDLLMLTHPHADHVSGVVDVLQRYRVKQVLYPALDYKLPAYDEFLTRIQKKNINSTLAQSGQQIKMGEGVVIEVLHPSVPRISGTASDIDNNSLVLRLSLGGVSFLLTSDTGYEAEFELMARRARLASTVLKVPHHGANTSTTPEFLAVVNPRLAIISVGKDNRFGHPSQEVMTRLKQNPGTANIYRTDEHGTVELITNGERLWVKTER